MASRSQRSWLLQPHTVAASLSTSQGMMNDYVMFKQAAETTDISQIEAQRKKINALPFL